MYELSFKRKIFFEARRREKKMVIKQGVKYRLVFCHFKIGTNDGSLKESREATIVCNLLSHLEYFIGIIGVQFRHYALVIVYCKFNLFRLHLYSCLK